MKDLLLFRLFVLAAAFSCAVGATAYDFVSGGIYYNVTGNNTVEVTNKDNNYRTYSGSVTIPSSVYNNGRYYTVVQIGDSAFYDCSGLNRVSFPNTVTWIYDYAFYRCTGLTSLTLPEKLQGVSQFAFEYCTALESLTFPKGIYTIDDYSFAECRKLTSVIIPNCDVVKTIGYGAFRNCSSLTHVTIPDLVTAIRYAAFNGCPLTDLTCWSINPPSLMSGAFSSDTFNNATLKVPNGCKSAYQAAQYWSNFTTIEELPGSFERDSIYYRITGNNTVEVTFRDFDASYFPISDYSSPLTIPSTVFYNGKTYQVTAIGQAAFYNCTDLLNVRIPNSVTTIGYMAFADCGLTRVEIGSGVTYIGESAFANCTELGHVACKATTPPTLASSNVFSSDTYSSAYLYVPKGCGSAYQVANGWKNFQFDPSENEMVYDFEENGIYYYIKGDNTVAVTFEYYAIGGLVPYSAYFGDVTIPPTVSHDGKTYRVTAIGYGAFFDSEVTSVTIPNSVISIGELAFYDCHLLTSVTIPNSVTSIDNGAFAYCNRLLDVTCLATTPPVLPGSFSVFSSETYNNALLTVPRGCKSAYQAASGWKSFTNIYENPYDFVVDGIYYAITGNNTVEVTFCNPGGGTYSGSVAIPSTVTYNGKNYRVSAIGDDAFEWSYQVSSVTIPNTVTSIGNFAFAHCPNIVNMTIPSSVTHIGLGAFDDACFEGLTCLATTPPAMASYVFDDFTGTLFVPRQSLNAYKSADLWKDFSAIQVHLDYALNTGNAAIGFTSTGDYSWTNVVKDNRVYAVSGNKGVHSSTSSLITTVKVGGGSNVTFDFKAWGEGTSWDVCTFLIDGNIMFNYGERNNDWETYSAQLSAGTHTLEWRYTKDSSDNGEGDYFAVDNVVVTGLITVAQGDVDGDGNVNIADVTAMIDYLLSGNATGISLSAADVNGDSSVNIADVTDLIDFLLNGN